MGEDEAENGAVTEHPDRRDLPVGSRGVLRILTQGRMSCKSLANLPKQIP